MIRNYLIVSFRQLARNKVVSLTHILGLSIGISASLVIYLLIRFENGFDKFQPDGERIYRVVMDVNFNGVDGHSAAVPAPLANAMGEEITGIDDVVPIMTFQGDAKVNVTVPITPQKVFKAQDGVVFTTASYFEMMPFEWIIGSPKSLHVPFSVILTERRARFYFPGTSLEAIVGRQLSYNDEVTAEVTGIVKDLSESSDLKANDFISYSTIAKTTLKENFMMDNWNDWMAYSSLFVKLSNSNDTAGVSSQINKLASRFRAADSSSRLTYALQPLNDIHFNPLYAGFNLRIASRKTLWALTLVAVFLLSLGCINFTNLASAQTSLRAREIGVRKSVGSSRKQLITQFLGEALCVTILAASLSMAISPLLLDLFRDFLPSGVEFAPWQQPDVAVFLFALVATVALLAGIYPSLILSRLRPTNILKGNVLPSSSSAPMLRRTLTIAQFMIAQVFIFGGFMVSRQLRYSLTQDLGYRKEAIVYFDVARTAKDNREPMLNEIRKLSGVSQATLGFLAPAATGAAFADIVYKKKDGVELKENVQVRWGEPKYLDLYDIKIVEGRNVQNGKDVHEILVNQTYMKEMGFENPTDVIGEQLLKRDQLYTIVGVMRDFHESSLRSLIGPLVFFNSDHNFFFHVALSPVREQWSSTLEQLRMTTAKFYPDHEFKYTFFDESLAQFYEEEQHIASLLNWSMAISMLISCMGLLGLVMHTAEARTKEVGIRKILGASVANVVSLLSWDFIKLVIIAFVLAAPISWWLTDRWLEGFAYKTSMSWWVFALSGAVMIMVAVLALSFQTLKTARANPVNSLRAD